MNAPVLCFIMACMMPRCIAVTLTKPDQNRNPVGRDDPKPDLDQNGVPTDGNVSNTQESSKKSALPFNDITVGQQYWFVDHSGIPDYSWPQASQIVYNALITVVNKNSGYPPVQAQWPGGFTYWVMPADLQATGPVTAIGDPHLTNIRGERFELNQPGTHVLLHIPRGASGDDTLLHVEATTTSGGVHRHCRPIFMQTVNVTGKWATAGKAGGTIYNATELSLKHQKKAEQYVDKVRLGVVCVRTKKGRTFLNFFADHLGDIGLPVGGILGEDDHAMVSSTHCDGSATP